MRPSINGIVSHFGGAFDYKEIYVWDWVILHSALVSIKTFFFLKSYFKWIKIFKIAVSSNKLWMMTKFGI